METVHLRAQTTAQGRLLMDLLTSLELADVDVTVTLQPHSDAAAYALGWPIGFWQRFPGSIPDFPAIEDVTAEEVEPLR